MSYWIFDGFNLLRTVPPLAAWEKSRGVAFAQEQLEQKLKAFLQQEGKGSHGLLCWDGVRSDAGTAMRAGILQIRHARPPESADDLILQEVKRGIGNRKVTVVTSDGALRGKLAGLKARLLTSPQFFHQYLRLDAGGRVQVEKPEKLTIDEQAEWLRRFEGK